MHFCTVISMTKSKGFDPIAMSQKTESIVVRGNERKYVQLGRPLRFYGGTTSATEVGCNLRCKFCFSDKPVWKPATTGKFYSPQEVFDGLDRTAKKYGHRLISASASEATIGLQHLYELLDLVEDSPYIYIVETNGLNIGADPSIAKELSRYKRVHVRVSIKGASEEEFHRLTGAGPEFYELAYQAVEHLIAAGVSCNACLMASFSDAAGINTVKQRLSAIAPGILKSLEIERINQFPKVRQRLFRYGLQPNKGISCITPDSQIAISQAN